MNSDLAWSAAADFAVTQAASAADADFILWSGSVRYTGHDALEAGRYRLLITEEELYEADGAVGPGLKLGTRLIYAETVPLDESLLAASTYPVSTTTLEGGRPPSSTHRAQSRSPSTMCYKIPEISC